MKKEIVDKVLFLLFSSITGFIELGSIIYSIRIGLSINQILLIALAYQLGCFFPTNIQISKTFTILTSIISIFLFIYISFFKFDYLVFWIATFFISANLQILRSFQKATISTGLKRIFRIIGFSLSPFYFLPIIGLFCILLSLSLIFNNNSLQNKINFYKLRIQEIIMVSHQMHYFSYSYFVIIIIMLVGNYNAFYASISFVLGWITYTLVSYILKKEKFLLYFIGGHVFLMLVLLAMSQIDYVSVKILLWVITGFGGGTVFCIEKLLNSNNDLKKEPLEFSENIGHVLGLALGIVIYNITKNYNSVILSSSILAFFTVVLMLIYNNSNQIKLRRENHD